MVKSAGYLPSSGERNRDDVGSQRITHSRPVVAGTAAALLALATAITVALYNGQSSNERKAYRITDIITIVYQTDLTRGETTQTGFSGAN